jgi:hypothetical protein
VGQQAAPRERPTYVTRAVVVAERLCAAKALEQRVGREHHVLDLANVAAGRARRRIRARDLGNVLHDALGRLGLARARLALQIGRQHGQSAGGVLSTGRCASGARGRTEMMTHWFSL